MHHLMLLTALISAWIPSAWTDDGSDEEPEQCKAALVPHPYPQRAINQIDVGYSGGPSYAAYGLASPEPVPLSVLAGDTDKMLVYCNGVCTMQDTFSESFVTWETFDGGGVFVDALANELIKYQDASTCIYVPPDELKVGESMDIEFSATVHEHCTLAKDHDTQVFFVCTVTRNDERDWEVHVDFDRIVASSISPPPCYGGSSYPCQLLGPSVNPNPAMTGFIVEYPADGMYLGELRPLRCLADDTDMMQMECGMPVHNPPISNFDQQDRCDDMNYSWSIVSGPGSGYFVYSDQATLFRATAPGEITIRVDVVTTDSETATDEVTFEITTSQIELVQFKGHIVLKSDRFPNLYSPAIWLDGNKDGDADDGPAALGGPLVDVNYPMAWVKKTPVKIQAVRILGKDTPTLPNAPKPMKGAKLEGTNGSTTFSGDAKWNAATSKWLATDPVTTGDLPDMVKKYDPYTIQWQLDFGNAFIVPLNNTDHRMYVVLAQPIKPGVGMETIYDVACGAADGKSTQVDVALAIWQKFQTGHIVPVRRDGYNNPLWPNTPMTYWPNPNQSCGDLASFLASGGNGTCGAWAAFLHAVLDRHAIPSTEVNLEAHTTPGVKHLVVKDYSGATGNGPWPLASLTRFSPTQLPSQGWQVSTATLAHWENHAVLEVGAGLLGFPLLLDPAYMRGPFWGPNRYIDLENQILLGIIHDYYVPNSLKNVVKQSDTAPDLVPVPQTGY